MNPGGQPSEWTLPKRVEGWSLVSALVLVITFGGAIWGMEHYRSAGINPEVGVRHRVQELLAQSLDLEAQLARLALGDAPRGEAEFLTAASDFDRSVLSVSQSAQHIPAPELRKSLADLEGLASTMRPASRARPPASPAREQLIEMLDSSGKWLPEIRTDLRAVSQTVQAQRSLGASNTESRLRAISNAVIVGLVLSLGIIVQVTRLVRVESERRQQAELMLAAGEARYWAVAENASDSILQVDGNGAIAYANRSARLIFGRGDNELLGKPTSSLFVEPLPADSLHSLTESGERQQGGEEQAIVERSGYRSDGTTFPLEMSMARWWSNGRPHFTLILRDISERMLAEQQLRQANEILEARVLDRTVELERVNASLTEQVDDRRKAEALAWEAQRQAQQANQAKSDFLANMSHEIRTPMNGILGMCELALDTELTGRQREYLGLVKSSAESLLTIINDILDYSKIEAGKLDLERLPFEVSALFEETLSILAVRAHAKGLELAYRLDPQLPGYAWGDANRLRQVLVNLIGNAVKFTEQGEVVVEARVTGPQAGASLEVSVRDSGIGIPADRLHAIFEPFEQADGSMTRRFGGTGLGLAISTRLVKLMGGSIAVASELGAGSTFTFRLPLEPAEAPAGQSAASRRGSFDGIRVLIVDDNTTNRRILTEVLRNWGFETAEAPDAQAALELCQAGHAANRPFRVAVVDMMMPGCTGLELARSLRAAEFQDLGILVLSSAGCNLPDDPLHELRISGSLSKPVRQSELFDLLAQTLDAPSQPPVSAVRDTPAHEMAGGESTLPELHILLAEDHPVNQKVAVRMLEGLGQKVRVVGNGEEAILALAEDSYDLVLMDVQMPVMDGLEAARLLRESERRNGTPHQRIVALTAHAMKGDRDQCLEAGFDDYLSKPIRRDALRDLIVGQARVARPAACESVLSIDRMIEACGNDRALALEVLGTFRELGPASLDRIESAAHGHDSGALALEAHGLRGTCLTLGADELAEACRIVEESARVGRLGEAHRSVAAVRKAWDRLTPALLVSEAQLS